MYLWLHGVIYNQAPPIVPYHSLFFIVKRYKNILKIFFLYPSKNDKSTAIFFLSTVKAKHSTFAQTYIV
jgi:hypothetical protein